MATRALQENALLQHLPGALIALRPGRHGILLRQTSVDAGLRHRAVEMKVHQVTAALLLLEVLAHPGQGVFQLAGIPVAQAGAHLAAIHPGQLQPVRPFQRQVMHLTGVERRRHGGDAQAAGEILLQAEAQCALQPGFQSTLRQHGGGSLQRQLHAAGRGGVAVFHHQAGGTLLVHPLLVLIPVFGVGSLQGEFLAFDGAQVAHAHLAAIHRGGAAGAILRKGRLHAIEREAHLAESLLQPLLLHRGIQEQRHQISRSTLLILQRPLLQRGAQAAADVDIAQVAVAEGTALLCRSREAPDTVGRQLPLRAHQHITLQRHILLQLLPLHPAQRQRAQHTVTVPMAQPSLLHQAARRLARLKEIPLVIHLHALEDVAHPALRVQVPRLLRELVPRRNQRRPIRVGTQLLAHQHRFRRMESELPLLQAAPAQVAHIPTELQLELCADTRARQRLNAQAILVDPHHPRRVRLITTDAE